MTEKIEYLFMPVECIRVFFSSEFSYLLPMKKITLSMYIKHRIHPFYVYNLVSFNSTVVQPWLQSSFRILLWPPEALLCPFTVNSCSHWGFISLITNEIEFLFIYLLASAHVKVFWVLFLIGLREPVLPDTNSLKVYVMHLLFSCFTVCLLFLLMMAFFI